MCFGGCNHNTYYPSLSALPKAHPVPVGAPTPLQGNLHTRRRAATTTTFLYAGQFAVNRPYSLE